MGRVVVVLLIGSFVIFGMVLKTPLRSYVFSEQQTTTTESSKDSARQAREKAARRASRDDYSPNPKPLSRNRARTASSTHAKKSVTRVLNDSAVYSFNSPASGVLQVLKKGDVVNTELEIIDNRGRWTLITGADRRVLGYVRSESLGLQSPVGAEN